MNNRTTIPSAAMMAGLFLTQLVSLANGAEPTTLIGHQKSVVDVEFSRRIWAKPLLVF